VFLMKLVSYRKIHRFRVSRIIKAPIRFVYAWCTDYRESDPKITGSKSKRKILMRTKGRTVYVVTYRNHGKAMTGINVVTLYPPRAWHLDFVGDEDDETGDYVLTSHGRNKTRLDMTFTERYKIRNSPSRMQDVKNVSDIWDKYVAALERDYARL